MTDIP